MKRDGMYQIEFSTPEVTACDCCGGKQTVLTRFVTHHGDAFAIYKAVLPTEKHAGRIHAIVSIGEWQEDSSPNDRVAFALQLWSGADNTNVSVVGPDAAHWSTGFFGRVLTREEALAHTLLEEVFRLTEVILERDNEISRYLESNEPCH